MELLLTVDMVLGWNGSWHGCVIALLFVTARFILAGQGVAPHEKSC